MRKALVASLVFVAVVATLMSAPVSAKGTLCEDTQEANSLYWAGGFTPYTPQYTGAFNRDLPNGKTKVKAPLEADALVEMDTTAGRKVVILLEGTELRWTAREDGTLVAPYALHECGNKIYAVTYPRRPEPPPQAQPQPQPPPTETSSKEMDEMRIQLWQMQQQLQAAATPPVTPPPATPVTTTKKSRFSLHLTLVLNGGHGGRYRDGYVQPPPYVRPGVPPGGYTGGYTVGGYTGGYNPGGYTTGYNPGRYTGYTNGYTPSNGGYGNTGYYY